jgi:hypothetical protein
MTELSALLAFRILIANRCTRCRESLKGSHRMHGGRTDLSENLRASLVRRGYFAGMTTCWINLISARSISLDSTFKLFLYGSYGLIDLILSKRKRTQFRTKKYIRTRGFISSHCLKINARLQEVVDTVFKILSACI